ncbi:hypothetical protein POM88_001227 [Heracleum sosnowskyi]|uniref:Uncharacterized protein n=1 Tax=Heracleum sosnowskyi TaxID=360622 RepID=A0AAD8JFP8_9APIA|nr:hypothetical protein POM88_001227 [Heracleum sosnowskyi]
MGAQWLRQGGKVPFSYPAKESGDSQGKFVTVDGAGGSLNPKIFAKGRDIRGDNAQERISGNQGIIVISDFQKSEIAGDNLTIENERESYTDLESNGLILTDPKRKRVDEPDSYGSNDK